MQEELDTVLLLDERGKTMKINKSWHVFLIASLAVSTLLSGCQSNTTEQVPTSSPTSSTQETVSEKSIYNPAYENYNNITELGIIINTPSEEDLGCLNIVDSYVYEENEKNSLLVIPKYNGSKITISKVEYTGERYIAKDVLFTKESTQEGYGLLVKASEPEGIPQIVITVTYQNKSCEHIVMYDGQNGNESIKYLKIENEAGKKQEGDLITPIQDATYLQDLNRFSTYEIDIDKDGNNEAIEVYCQSEIEPDGTYLFDDGQQWALVLRKGEEIYPLFEKSYIQLGGLEYTVYVDYDNYEQVHVIVTYKSGANIIYYDCTYDEESGNILRNAFYEANNINLLKDWN